jgi:hypothetical protein
MEVNGEFHAPAALLQRRASPIPVRQKSGCAPQPVWIRWRLQNTLSPPEIRWLSFKSIVTCGAGCGLLVAYMTGFGLDDWIYWHLIHSARDYRPYSAIADSHTLHLTVTHALWFSVFTSRILATDLWQSHCSFKSHEVFFSQPNSFLVIILQLPAPKTRVNSSAPKFISRQAGVSKQLSSSQLSSSL